MCSPIEFYGTYKSNKDYDQVNCSVNKKYGVYLNGDIFFFRTLITGRINNNNK